MRLDKGFLYRRLAKYITCVLRIGNKKQIALTSKHHVSSLQDVFLNPFYWECLFRLETAPKKILDLGANFGYFTLLANQVGGYRWPKAVCEYQLIEANKNLSQSISDNLSAAGVENAHVHIGLAGPVEEHFFEPNQQNLMASKIGKKGEITSFIDFNDAVFRNPDLIKIDIEGAEFELFRNYFNFITTARYLIIEFHKNDTEFENIEQKLGLAGYKTLIKRTEESGYLNCLYAKLN